VVELPPLAAHRRRGRCHPDVFLAVGLAPWIAPYDPFDARPLKLMDALQPPAWQEGGKANHPLGTDNQGRDMQSAIMYGRFSLMIGLAAIVLSVTTGVLLGLLAGFRGGWVRGPSSCGWPTSSSPCPPS
jgi:peptide/nickel transport system permease protein